MHSPLLALSGAVSLLASAAVATPSSTESAAAPAFTYNATTFLLHGEPFQIIGGQMDPQRIPYQYWRDRLSKARAMGLNTIFSYVFWDQLEPKQGEWRGNEPENNIAEYFKIAQEEGLHVVLRPGPYICGEHEWGGFPAWLSEVPGMVVRAYNKPFLDASKSYFTNLAKDLAPLTATKGGPILMVQVENEYGSFGHDQQYTEAIRDILLQEYDVPLYTNDGGAKSYLAGGEVHNVLAEVDGDSQGGFAARDKYITDKTELGPLLNGEYYTNWLDLWGSDYPHQTTQGDAAQVKTIQTDIDYTIGERSASMSFYMVHGGTNFGYQNGAEWQNQTQAVTTSYDYGAPIDESGRTTDLYHSIRDTLSKYVKDIPSVPKDVPRMAIPKFNLEPAVSLFSTVNRPTKWSKSPLTMEALGQSHGFILYSHRATKHMSGVVSPGDRARDRVLIYVNDKLQGIIDSSYTYPPDVSVSMKAGDKLDLLVENLGRVNYWNQFSTVEDAVRDPQKGIMGDVKIGSTIVTGWNIYSIPLDTVEPPKHHWGKPGHGGPPGHYGPPSYGPPSYGGNNYGKKDEGPMFYHGAFTVPKSLAHGNDAAALDTFLSLPNGLKGNVWVNGFHLGRYWMIGPQQSLYLPGTVVNRHGQNDVVVLELEPTNLNETMVAEGIVDRKWFNNPNPDCLGCK